MEGPCLPRSVHKRVHATGQGSRHGLRPTSGLQCWAQGTGRPSLRLLLTAASAAGWRRREERGPSPPCPAQQAWFCSRPSATPSREKTSSPSARGLGGSQRVFSLKLGGEQRLQWGLGGGWRRLGRRWLTCDGRGGEEGHGGGQGRGGAGRGTRGLADGPVVEEEGALLDEELDDCLVGARGCEGVHGAEVRPHQGGPEADGQVLTGHEVHLVVVADSVGDTRLEVRAPARDWSRLPPPVLSVSASPAALLPPPPPCKLRTEEAPGLGLEARAPLAPSSEAPEVGDTALAVRKGSLSVPQQGSRNNTLSGEEQVWLENNPTLWE